MEVDPHTARFLDWAFKNLDDDTYYDQAVEEIKARLDQFYAQSKDQLLTDLKAKMIRGSHEHGEPSHPLPVVQQEINNEYMDLLGWMLIERWIKNKNTDSE